MDNLKFEQMNGDIYRLKVPFGCDWTGVTLIDGEKKILVDSGSCAADVDEILVPALAQRGLHIEDLDYLCTTHCHGDHVGGHARIRQRCGARIACGRTSVPKLADPLLYSRRIRAAFPGNSPPAPPVLDGVEPDAVLNDGEELAGRLRLVETPGHDTDCVCWYDIRTGTLITGDSLQGNGTVIEGTALYMDVSRYRATIRKISGIDAQSIVCGHTFTMVGNRAAGAQAVQTFLHRCEAVTEIYEDFIRRGAAEGQKDPVSLASGLIEFMGNRVPDYLFLPLYTVVAHLREIKDIRCIPAGGH